MTTEGFFEYQKRMAAERERNRLKMKFKDFYVKPIPKVHEEMRPLVRSCMEDRKMPGFAFRFQDEDEYRQFGQVVLLSKEAIYWREEDAYIMIHNELVHETRLTDYIYVDVMFLVVNPLHGTMPLFADFAGKIMAIRKFPNRTFICFIGNAKANNCPVTIRTLAEAYAGVPAEITEVVSYIPKSKRYSSPSASSQIIETGTASDYDC